MGNFQTRHYLAIWYWLMASGPDLGRSRRRAAQDRGAHADLHGGADQSLLVARHYMHLKHEAAIVCAIFLVPLAFIVIFLFGLLPDFVYHLNKP